MGAIVSAIAARRYPPSHAPAINQRSGRRCGVEKRQRPCAIVTAGLSGIDPVFRTSLLATAIGSVLRSATEEVARGALARRGVPRASALEADTPGAAAPQGVVQRWLRAKLGAGR